MDAFIFIAMDTQKRKVAHWLEKHSNRAQIFAECAVIFKYKSQHNTYNIVKCISYKEDPEHDSLQIRDFHQKQAEKPLPGIIQTSHTAEHLTFPFAAFSAAYKAENPVP